MALISTVMRTRFALYPKPQPVQFHVAFAASIHVCFDRAATLKRMAEARQQLIWALRLNRTHRICCCACAPFTRHADSTCARSVKRAIPSSKSVTSKSSKNIIIHRDRDRLRALGVSFFYFLSQIRQRRRAFLCRGCN